jgi:hypothetical protein
VTFVLQLDARRFVDALRRLARVFNLATRHGNTLRRVLFGPRNVEWTGDGRLAWWQSDLCAAWLHESCPAPDLCDCRCDHPERKATR